MAMMRTRSIRSSITEITARGSNEFLTTEADVVTLDGQRLLTSRSTIVSRGTA